MASTPMFLITGTLGAGKTTFLNHLLNLESIKSRNICLIINEFGELGIDGQLVEAADRPMYEINKGSLFCICIKTDFIKTLQEIANDVKPEMLIVEATGMAEPRDIQDFIDVPELQEAFHIQTNLCIVDTPNFIRIAPMLRAARQQASWADGLVLNKTDLVDATELEQVSGVLQDMNPNAPQERVTYGEVSEEFVNALQHTVRRGEQLTEPPDPVLAQSFGCDHPVDRAHFEQSIQAMGDQLLRLKGHVDFGNGPEFVEVVGDRLTISPDKKIKEDGTAFIAIGWRIRSDDFRSAVQGALG